MASDSDHKPGPYATKAADRRRSSRIHVRQCVRVATDGETINGEAYNVSFGGLSLKSPVALVPGTEVAVELPLPGRHVTNTLQATCRVVHAAPAGSDGWFRAGLEFMGLDGRNAGLLEAFFAEQRASPDQPPADPGSRR